MKTVRISELDWENYQTFLQDRYNSPKLITVDKEYKGGKIHVQPNPEKMAIDVFITKEGVGFNKTIDIDFDLQWYEERSGGLFNQKVEYRTRKIWRESETMQKALDLATAILDGLALLDTTIERQTINVNINY